MSALEALGPTLRLAKSSLVDENTAAPFAMGKLPHMHARPSHCALLLASALLCTPNASFASSAASVSAECGSRADFESEVRARLGPSVRLSEVDVLIEPRLEAFHLQITVGTERREVDDPSCTELFRAAIVIAVSLLLERQEQAPPVAAPVPAVSPPPARRSRPALAIALGGGVVAGTLPHPVPAVEMEGKVLGRYFGVAANARYLPPAERRDATRQGVVLHAWGAGVTGIFRPSRRWEARVGFSAQRLSGRGVGLDNGYAADVWAAGPTLGLGWVPFKRGRFWAGVGATGQLNLARGQFEILNYDGVSNAGAHIVYRVPRLAADAFVRLGVVW